MSIDIQLTLNDKDVKRFQDLIIKDVLSSSNIDESVSFNQTSLKAIEELITKTEAPTFIKDSLDKLMKMAGMANDHAWGLDAESKGMIFSALKYYRDPNDLIPDNIPSIGLLDDALYAETISGKLDGELRAYDGFCKFRLAEEVRRQNRGLEPTVNKDDWIADQKSVLRSRTRVRRFSHNFSHGWRARY